MDFSTACEQLAERGRQFHARGWMLGTSGNLSAVLTHEPLKVAITASSVDKGRLTSDQFIELDSEARVLTPARGKPSAETLLHLAIIRLRGAGAVLHTHSIWSTILSDYHNGSGGMFIEGYEMLKGLAGVTTHEHREWLPILENSQDIEELAAEASTLLKDDAQLHGFLIRRHGMYTWGVDVAEATRHVEILEFLLESIGRRQMMEPQH
jgi:methylthioribulose-1-phosphate dehydratase